MMAPYRQPSLPESEYDRKVKSSVLRSELSGPSRLSDSDPTYREFLAQQYEEQKADFKDFDEIAEGILKRAIDEFKKETGLSEISRESYEAEKYSAAVNAARFQEMAEHPEYFYTVPPEFERQDKTVEDRRSLESAEFNKRCDEVMASADESLRKANEFIESLNRQSETSHSDSAIVDQTDMISDIAAYDMMYDQNFRRKRTLGYDSEVDAM